MVSVTTPNDDCKPCQGKTKTSKQKKQIGWLTGVLLVLLPKCPFCIMAYSGTLILCSKDMQDISSRSFFSPGTFYFTAFFCLVVLLSILFNYRDFRTKYALLLAGMGSAMIILSVTEAGGWLLYYCGVCFVFAGVWLNGSLLYVLGKMKLFIKSERLIFSHRFFKK